MARASASESALAMVWAATGSTSRGGLKLEVFFSTSWVKPLKTLSTHTKAMVATATPTTETMLMMLMAL